MTNPYRPSESPLNQSSKSPDLSPWAPLRTPMFRVFWIASLGSNFGTWIHEVGAGWLMTSLDSSPEMVSGVRTAMALPIVFLAIPAGALADRMDRRQLLLVTHFLLLATTATLSTLTFSGAITAWSLLALTFVMGLGLVMLVPTWQASIPELVPRSEMPRAIALGSVSFNLARAVGPAVGGLLIASTGVWVAFLINAFSFLGVIGVLFFWRRERKESSRGLSYTQSVYQGVRYVKRNEVLRNVMFGVGLFILPASALWSLLPLVVKERLAWGPDGFGLVVACVGIGAVIAAQVLPRFQSRLGADRAVAAAMCVFASGLLMASQATWPVVVIVSAVVMGGGWMMTLTTLNSTAQVNLPSRMRARGMSCYLTAVALSMSLGSFFWGQVAGATDLATAQTIAAVATVCAAGISLCFRLGTKLA